MSFQIAKYIKVLHKWSVVEISLETDASQTQWGSNSDSLFVQRV